MDPISKMKENSKLNYSSYDDRFVSKLDRDNLLRASAIINAMFVFSFRNILSFSRSKRHTTFYF